MTPKETKILPGDSGRIFLYDFRQTDQRMKLVIGLALYSGAGTVSLDALMAFTMSLDDFVISYFTFNLDQNLSMVVYSSARKGVEPTMYALSACIFVVVLTLLLIANLAPGKADPKKTY